MNVKSRYEVIAELEEQKRELITEREGFPELLRYKEIELRDKERELGDLKSDLKFDRDRLNERKQTIAELIKSIDDSLKRFHSAQSQKKQ